MRSGSSLTTYGANRGDDVARFRLVTWNEFLLTLGFLVVIGLLLAILAK